MLRKRGFTIIELLVVIVIIGLLVAMAATSYNTAQKRSRDDARKTQVHDLSLAVETYYSVNHRFPGKYTAAESGGPPSTTDYNITSGCEQYDTLRGEYFYYYYPTSLTGTTVPSLPCNQRNGSVAYSNSANGYTYNPADYQPFPTWIPGLGPFINPMPTDSLYQSGSSNQAAYDPNNDIWDASDSGPNQTRTYVYRRLNNGYAVYTRLEIGTIDPDAYQSTTLRDQPNLPTGAISITGKNIYMIRK